MNSLARLKENLTSPRQRIGQQSVVVDRRHLREILEHFEQLDTAARALHPETQGRHVYERLALDIEAAYQQSRDGEALLVVIMETLGPLIKERRKQVEIARRMGEFT